MTIALSKKTNSLGCELLFFFIRDKRFRTFLCLSKFFFRFDYFFIFAVWLPIYSSYISICFFDYLPIFRLTDDLFKSRTLPAKLCAF